MGNQQLFIPSRGFSTELYMDHNGFEAKEVNGVKGKVLLKKNDPKGGHYSLPAFADTSDMYFKVGHDGDVVQGRVYTDRKTLLDFDWAHTHTNTSDGRTFTKGTVHVQEYKIDSNGKLVRLSNYARPMTDAEIKKYGPIINAYNPNVQFR